jgi:transposase InsO family protein
MAILIAVLISIICGTVRSPWQRAYIERVIGTIRRECLDHVIVFNEGSLRSHMQNFCDYYLSSGKIAVNWEWGHSRTCYSGIVERLWWFL